MANLQALAADNETIIYLSSEGEGTDLSPFQSVFYSEQFGTWVVDTQLAQPLTNTELRAAPIVVDVQLLQGVTNAELRAAPVIVDTQLSQGITDAELRASAIIVDTQLEQSLTDVQLRASPVVVDTQLSQSLTNTELRAAPVVVDTQHQQALTHSELVSEPLPLPIGAATAANQLSIPGFNIPEYDTLTITEDANGELVSVEYRKLGATVKTLNFTYSDVVFAAPYSTTTVEAV